MSRIGKRPIPVADGVQVQYTDREFSVKGPKGEMKMRIHDDVELNTEEGVIQLAPNASRGITPMLGTTWALVRNMLVGVSTGFDILGFDSGCKPLIFGLTLYFFCLVSGITTGFFKFLSILLFDSDNNLPSIL